MIDKEKMTDGSGKINKFLSFTGHLSVPIYLLAALLLSDALILFAPDWFWLRFSAALALIFVLPGWAWVSALDWMHTDDLIERIILVIGCASVISALALFLALMLPGPFTEMPNLLALNLATLSGLLWQIGAQNVNNKSLLPQPSIVNTLMGPGRKSKIINWVLFILLIILAVAAFTRLTRLGYAEFHEDELENMRLIVRAYKGEEYAAFLDSKGPIHWLLPAALWYLNGWLSEAVARTPVAITSLLLIPMIFVLGRRMNGEKYHIGLLAAGFVAVNGFFVAYARHVENQSLIVFWGALAMWFAYRAYRENLPSFWLYVAVILAIGLIAHPDVLLYLPVFAYLLWLKVWPFSSVQRQLWPWLAGAGIIFAGLVALFYVPYLFDPQIGLVYQYFATDRIGEGLFYNRVSNLFDQDKLYSTYYHAPVLVLLLAWLLARQFAQAMGRRWGWLILVGLGGAIASTLGWPEAWIVGGVNLAFGPYALLALLFLWLPKTGIELKILWLWLTIPLGALLFLAKDAADHIQIAYTAWALLSAWALADLWQAIDRRIGVHRHRTARLFKGMIVLTLVLIVPLVLFYQYLAFDTTVTAYWQVKADSAANPTSIYNLLYGSIPRPRKIFSNPRLGGWKAVGYAWNTGVLTGDFRSINESFAVPVWYTFQTPRSCYDDPQNYWVRRDWDGWPDEEKSLPAQGYTLTRIVLVDQTEMLHLYQKNAPAGQPEKLDSELLRSEFDRLATPARFAQEDMPAQASDYNFGDKLRLRGYDLPVTIAHPGDLLPVTVYWEALARMEARYRGFVHLVGPDGTRWGQHDDDPACRLLTTDMRPGQHSSRQFRLPVDPTTPPGDYQIVLGVYDPATSTRLPIWNNQTGQALDDSLILGIVKVNNEQ